ncbi:DUF4258 domain-containing protein [Nocardioides sp.]|uniref:DUF4258 domain-containing protein n=1 Tax=Nocardioides sp. TaxID=35761 RepID=UPI00343434A7
MSGSAVRSRASVSIRITAHAARRLAERGITQADVEAVVLTPGVTWEDTENGSCVCSGSLSDGRTLVVCLVNPPPANGDAIVKTAFYR